MRQYGSVANNSMGRRHDCPLCRLDEGPGVLRRSKAWSTALNRNQNLLGKLIVVLRRHEEAVTGLRMEEWVDLFAEVRWATERLTTTFAPDHFNYAFLQNEDRHVHLHVIPRYAFPRHLGSVEFVDSTYPDHYAVGETRALPPELLASVSSALLR